MLRNSVLLSLLAILPANESLQSQDRPQKLPRENVIEIPAIRDGLCVSNVFQSNMV